MSMEHNEMQGGQDQQAPPPPTASADASQNGSPAGSQNSQGQRRRRRRRKANKGAAAAQAANGASQANGAGNLPLPAAQSAENGASQPQAPAMATDGAQQQRAQRANGREGFVQDGPREQHQPRQSSNNQQGSGKKHKNKGGSNGGSSGSAPARQYQKGSYSQQSASSNREYNPGNGGPPPMMGMNNGNGNGARRKNKIRRTAPSFVGPMDHSYRVVNGNVADGPPSTMDFRSNVNGNGGNGYSRTGYSDFVEPMPPAMLRADAPTRILCFIEELFVVARMQEHARKLGVKVGFCKAEKETIANLMDMPEAERPSLIIFDLNNANAKPLTLIPKLKAKLKRGTSIIGYLSHIQGDLKLKAIEAGCDTVMPKSAFSQNLPNLLRRHGLEEEELEALEV